MLHVFLVDTGIMLKFDMELAVESVGYLMEAVHQRVFIPANKQVLLSASGEPLSPSNRVASYASCGTETQPIYLFSKSTIESPIPPSPSINLGSVESLMTEVETCLKMKPKYETLVARAQLAADFQRLAVEIGENCENLVGDQFLQKSGWKAVVLNLDQITSAFEQHVQVFEEYYENFFTAKLQYSEMIQKFECVLMLLKKLPLLNSILRTDEQPITLLQWISTHDEQSSIENMVRQVHEALNKCSEDALHGMVDEAHKVLDSVNNEGMKEIKGLNERLESLQQRLLLVKQLVQDQTDMAQGFQQNKMRAEHVGDPSVLPDLCASHQKQLTVLRKNHYKIRDIRNLCSRAKDELSTNLHARLRWVMFIEKSIFECDSRLLVYHESLKRIKKRLDIFEQVYEAPKMYILAVLEVLRRKSFSAQFLEWSKSVSESAINARTEELRKREMFTSVFGNHFVKNLFPGLDRQPLPFAEDPPVSCDEHLPDISVDDIRLLQETAPELMSELHLGDMESSLVIQTCLSQSSLTKFVDPRSNKTLEETVNFREKAHVDNNQLTMSVLHREISRGDVVDLSFPGSVQFQVGSASSQDDDVIDGAATFEAGSLSSLSKEKMLVGSSDSEALMFHSAELDFTSPSPGVSSPIIASPSSVRSSSGKSSSGKSSSSPIAIKTSSSGKNWRCSQSLSPQSVPHVVKEDVFSLPNFERQASRLSVTDDKNSSQNSCRSLSEAIRSVEINNKLATSGDLLKVTYNTILELKEKLATAKEEAKASTEFVSSNLKTVRETFFRCISNKIEKIASLENLISDMKSDHHTQIESLEHEIEEYTKDIETLNSSREEMSDKHKEENEKHRQTIEFLQSDNKELSKLKEDNECQISELQSETKRLRELYEQLQQESSSKDTQYIQQIELLQHECSKRQENFDDLEKDKQNVTEELKDVALQLETLRQENGTLRTQIAENSDSTQQSIDEHLSHVSSVTTQNKELKKKLTEKEQELSQVLMMKDSLEAQKQTNFNAVFNKIKKDKDAQIKELASKLASCEKDLQSHKNRNSSLNNEIGVHKEAYSSLESEVNKLQDSKKEIENTVAELNEQMESLKEEKLRVMQELKTQYDEGLEKAKAEMLLESEVEKQRSLEQIGKSESTINAAVKESMSSSIEEGLDALELDQLMEKIKVLENENAKMKETLAEKEKKENQDKEKVISASPKAQKVVRTSTKPVEKIDFRDLDIGSLVVLCYDDTTHHYVALTVADERVFLHPESQKEILSRRGAPEKRQWMIACITQKETCIAKKAINSFNLPVNTYFSRIHVKVHQDYR